MSIFNQQGQNVTNQYNAETIVLNDELAKIAFNALKAQIEALTTSDQEKQSTIKSQQETIAALVQQKGRKGNAFDVDEALRGIVQNDLSKADAILAAVIDEDELAIAETAKRYMQRGALWFNTDTDKAISSYHRAVQLAPSNAESWNQLGCLYQRHGRLEDAEKVYNAVKQIGIDENDQVLQAIAYSNIGTIYKTQGKLDDALSMYQNSLEISEALGRQEGIAIQCANIGGAYQIQGKLADAKQVWLKSEALFKSLGINHQAELLRGWLEGLE